MNKTRTYFSYLSCYGAALAKPLDLAASVIAPTSYPASHHHIIPPRIAEGEREREDVHVVEQRYQGRAAQIRGGQGGSLRSAGAQEEDETGMEAAELGPPLFVLLPPCAAERVGRTRCSARARRPERGSGGEENGGSRWRGRRWWVSSLTSDEGGRMETDRCGGYGDWGEERSARQRKEGVRVAARKSLVKVARGAGRAHWPKPLSHVPRADPINK